MKKSYFFLSAALVAFLLALIVVLALLAAGYRFSTLTLSDYGRVTYYGKSSGGTVYLDGLTATYTRAEEKLAFSNGDWYVGEIKHYLPNGTGTYHYASGDFYEGEVVNGLLHGKGKYTFANGDFFEGSFDRGEFTDGSLTLMQKGKRVVLTGSFKKSNFDGNASYLFSDGTYYEGGYHNGLPNGAGKVTLPNGDSYEGTFRDGCFSGFGTYTFQDGSVLSCIFENGVPNGPGRYTYTENGVEKSITGQFYDGYYLPESES